LMQRRYSFDAYPSQFSSVATNLLGVRPAMNSISQSLLCLAMFFGNCEGYVSVEAGRCGWTNTLPQQIVYLKGQSVLASNQQSVAGEKAQMPKEWKATTTATGGELGGIVEILEVSVKAGKREGMISRTLPGGKPEVKYVNLSEPAVKKLWKALADVDAMNLADFTRTSKDSPDYTIRLEMDGKTHSMRVRGYSQSEKHLILILAIEKCVTEGVPP
jgi:hypothetical protein